tara:strand:- start:130 stop:1866 length:1737 start_codon:yes stop_codon:yes gene_type:complete
MRKIVLLFLLFPFIALSQQNIKKVLIIGIDGCRADALELANTPVIDNLIQNGIYSPDALNDDITVSGPGWSAILCGVWSDKHLSIDNSFNNTDYFNFPPIFKYAEDFDDNLNTVSICNWNPINDNIVQNYADFKLNVSSDYDVSSEASTYITNNDPDLIFLHFDDVDHAGHNYGFSPNITEYITSIEAVDDLLDPVMQAIYQRPNYLNEDWIILVTSDHGGVGTSHGGTSIEHENVVVIVSGDNIQQLVIEKDSSLILDSVYNCLSDSVELKFDGIDDYVQISTASQFDFGVNQDFTIECRIRTSTSGDVAIVGNKDWNSGNNKGFVFSFKYPSGPEWKINIGDGVNRADINTGGLIANNQWHTLSVSFDRDGFMKMYEDGLLIDSADISYVGDITTNSGLFCGMDIYQNYPFSGSVSQLRVWDTILNSNDIQSWYCNDLNPTHPSYNNLIGYWHMNEGGNTVLLNDLSINNNNAIVNGASWYNYDSLWVYDYSNTPRIVDVPVTALNHLCIPINSSWLLDGVSLTPNCLLNNFEDINFNSIPLKIMDFLGREVDVGKDVPLIYFYNNGVVKKKLIIE